MALCKGIIGRGKWARYKLGNIQVEEDGANVCTQGSYGICLNEIPWSAGSVAIPISEGLSSQRIPGLKNISCEHLNPTLNSSGRLQSNMQLKTFIKGLRGLPPSIG